MAFRSEPVLGNRALEHFDVCVIGSGTGASAAAEVLARDGQKVLVLEAGSNRYEGLDDPDPLALRTVFANDEIKLRRRFLADMDPLAEPRSYRPDESAGARTYVGDVNNLPKTVGGAAVISPMTTLRIQPFDFELGSRLGERWPGASFADWPLGYDELEPFYTHAERVLGVRGDGPEHNPFEPPRSAPLPMGPGPLKASEQLIGEAAAKLGYHPYLTARAIASQPYDGRPACMGCGFCIGFGCPIHAKGTPAVTTLRRALLTGNVRLHAETRVVRLELAPGGREIGAVLAIGPDGERLRYRADRYVLAASPIEDARLLLLSGDGAALGNSSGLVGRNLMFHRRNEYAGVTDARLRASRGGPPSMGFADFRGDPEDPARPLGGVVITGGQGELVLEALIYSQRLRMRGSWLASWLRQSPMRDRMLAVTMYAEDAPQPSNRVDLDPDLRDLDGLPVPRITYRHHAFELHARDHYTPKLIELLRVAGARYVMRGPIDMPSNSRHILGTLRFGNDPKRSVCDRSGRFHDIGNLHAADGALFPTSSGYNPILTISAVGAWVGASMLDPRQPARLLMAQPPGPPTRDDAPGGRA